MNKRTTLEEREAEKLKGIGKLLDPTSGQPLTEAKYSVTCYDEFAETFTGWNKVEGGGKVEVFVTDATLPGFTGARLTLEMEDGRRVTGVFKRISGNLLFLVQKGGLDE